MVFVELTDLDGNMIAVCVDCITTVERLSDILMPHTVLYLNTNKVVKVEEKPEVVLAAIRKAKAKQMR